MYKDFVTAVQREADTCKTKINAAEVSRVVSLVFVELYRALKQNPLKCLVLIVKGLELAAKKCDKK